MLTVAQQTGYLARSRLFQDRLYLRVPWKQAARLRDHLSEHGLVAIVCYEPSDHTAGLEFRPGSDPDTVLRAFRAWNEAPDV
jgi:hypothetical protein